MFRKSAAKKIQNNNEDFRLRGHEVKRIEAFSDAVFAFAVTLLIVSLEVPKNFEELMVTMRGFFAFGISFLFLMLIWHEQNIFFRRYNLDDHLTIFLNGALIFLVLFYVYPLKFLFTLIFNNQIYHDSQASMVIEDFQTPQLMTIYGSGFGTIYLLFFFMYKHALRKRELLQLTPVEAFDTKTKMYSHLVFVFAALLSIVIAWVLPVEIAGLSGYLYILIGPAFTIYYTRRGKAKRKLFG